MLTYLLLLASCMYSGTASSSTPATDHYTEMWTSDKHLADPVNDVTIKDLQDTPLKKNFKVDGTDQVLKVNFYQMFTRFYRGLLNPGKLVRITSMVLCWIPQANGIEGKVTLSLVDNRKRKTDANRIESEVTFMPGFPVVGVFYHNYAMELNDLRYMQLEFITHDINMIHGTMGRLAFGYKTIITGPRFYNRKYPEVFYLPVEDLPELSVEEPMDIVKGFIEKIKKKREDEIKYFANVKRMIDMGKRPINEVAMTQQNAIKNLQTTLSALEKYKKDAKTYQINADMVNDLEEAIKQTTIKIEAYTPKAKKSATIIELNEEVSTFVPDI